MAIEIEHKQAPNPEPYRVKLERGQKGGYGWEIIVWGADPLEVLEKIRALDRQLKNEYAGGL